MPAIRLIIEFIKANTLSKLLTPEFVFAEFRTFEMKYKIRNYLCRTYFIKNDFQFKYIRYILSPLNLCVVTASGLRILAVCLQDSPLG